MGWYPDQSRRQLAKGNPSGIGKDKGRNSSHSTDFLASDFIADNELPPLLKAAIDEGITILPIIVKPSIFSDSNLATFQSVNDPSLPLSAMSENDQEEILVKLTKRIKKLIE